MILAVILLSILFSASAQILLKIGMDSIQLEPTIAITGIVWRVATNNYVLAGVSLHALALVIWLYALRHVDVSYAYPFIALGFVFTLAVGHFFLNENVNAYRMAGVALIGAGIYFVARS